MDGKKIIRIFLLILLFILQGCASSGFSRHVASELDSFPKGTGNNSLDIVNSYQNTTQATKGAIIGGVAGGVAGSLVSGVGALPGAATGAILGGALGAYIDAHTTLVDQIENRGAKVIVLGDQVLITIPSSRIFEPYTPNILYSAYSTLDLIAELIGNFVNMSVKVAAYTNLEGSDQVNRSLSQEQANNVQKYLWRHGVDTRMLYAVGNGATNFVDKISLEWGRSWNYRIEITFEKLPV